MPWPYFEPFLRSFSPLTAERLDGNRLESPIDNGPWGSPTPTIQSWIGHTKDLDHWCGNRMPVSTPSACKWFKTAVTATYILWELSDALGRIDEMQDQWLFKSETYDNCNCAVNCGCQFNLPSTHGYCQSAFVGNIVEGYFNDTPIAGLTWAGLYKWPGEIADGNGRCQIIIDEHADETQRTALETIISGGACKPLSNLFSVFASTCSEYCETAFLPIELEANLEQRTANVEIPGIMTSTGRPIINRFNGEPFHIALARPSGSFEFTYAEIGLGTTSVTGDMEMNFKDSWAHYCVHHFNHDGLVRERSRLTAWLGT